MCQIDRNSVAVEVLRDIALDEDRMVAERQRAIDALTLFPTTAVAALEYVSRKAGLDVLKDRADLYVKRIKSGIVLNMSA